MIPTYAKHIVLFVLTFFTLTFSDVLLNPTVPQTLETYLFSFTENWMYATTLLFILFAHEMGHYLPARFYGVRASLPYFIPLPFGPIGTMGAVIQIKDRIPHKKALFDIGIGGPLVSLVLSAIVWIIGISLSEVVEISKDFDRSNYLFFGDSLFTYFTSQWMLGPIDFTQVEIQAHPLAKAGWVGLLVTAINLLPFGQLDGGHVIYSVFGESYRKWIRYLFVGFIFLSLYHFTWLVWSFLIYYLLKVEHPYVNEYPSGLDKRRKILGYLILLSLIFIFVPKPIILGAEFYERNLLEELLFNLLGV